MTLAPLLGGAPTTGRRTLHGASQHRPCRGHGVTVVRSWRTIRSGRFGRGCRSCDFNGQMSQRLDAKRLADGWARMAGLVGAYEGMSEAFAHRVADHTVVEIPLRFEAGEATGRIIFDEDGKVAGLWLRP